MWFYGKHHILYYFVRNALLPLTISVSGSPNLCLTTDFGVLYLIFDFEVMIFWFCITALTLSFNVTYHDKTIAITIIIRIPLRTIFIKCHSFGLFNVFSTSDFDMFICWSGALQVNEPRLVSSSCHGKRP